MAKRPVGFVTEHGKRHPIYAAAPGQSASLAVIEPDRLDRALAEQRIRTELERGMGYGPEDIGEVGGSGGKFTNTGHKGGIPDVEPYAIEYAETIAEGGQTGTVEIYAASDQEAREKAMKRMGSRPFDLYRVDRSTNRYSPVKLNESTEKVKVESVKQGLTEVTVDGSYWEIYEPASSHKAFGSGMDYHITGRATKEAAEKHLAKLKERRPRDYEEAKVRKVDTGSAKVKVGQDFYASWGYDQTNVDFVRVVGFTPTGKTAIVQRVGKEMVSSDEGGIDHVSPGKPYGPKFRMKLGTITHSGEEGKSEATLRGSYPFAFNSEDDKPLAELSKREDTFWPYTKPVYETAIGYGH